VLQRADGHDARDVAPQRGREGRLTDPEVPDVAYDEEVAVEQLGVSLDEGLQVALGLLHALEDELDRAGGLPVEDPHRAQVSHQPADVVGRAPAIHPPVLLAGRGPRVRGPPLLRRSRLHVVVRIEHDHGGALGSRQLGVDRRVAAGDVHETGPLETGVLEQVQGHPAHALDRLGGVPGERDRGDGDQLLQIPYDSRHQVRRPLDDLLNIHGCFHPFGLCVVRTR
jgi:hypothetical protein